MLLLINLMAVSADWSGALNFTEYYLDTNKDVGYEFQTYEFSLAPSIVVNDAATVYFELGLDNYYPGPTKDMADQIYQRDPNTTPYGLYAIPYFSTPITLYQFYVELYTKAGPARVGRRIPDWGLGAVYNQAGGQFRDGIDFSFNVGPVVFTPHLYKLGQFPNLEHKSSSFEYGVSVFYDSKPTALKMGLLYSKMKTGNKSELYLVQAADSSATPPIPQATYQYPNYSIFDFYFEKKFNDLSLKVELPKIDGQDGPTKIDMMAFIFNLNYDVNDRFFMGADYGYLSGDDTDMGSVMTLNPAFKIANIFGSYQYAVLKKNDDFAGPFTTVLYGLNYGKLYASYNFKNVLSLSPSVIYVKTNKLNGWEIDLDSSYALNENASITANLGVLMQSESNDEVGKTPYMASLGFDYSF